MIRAPYVYTYILKVIWMIQEVEEGHGYDEETIIYVNCLLYTSDAADE